MTTLNTKIKFRNDLSTNWETLNPILLKGEPGYDTQKKIFKVGDGVTPWNTLEGIAAPPLEESTLYNYTYPGGLINDIYMEDSRIRNIAATDMIEALGTNFGTTAYAVANMYPSKISLETSHPTVTNAQMFMEAFGRTNNAFASLTSYSGVATLDFKLKKINISTFVYQITVGTGPTYDTPLTLDFLGSNDGLNFTTLLRATGLTTNKNQLDWVVINFPLGLSYYRYIKIALVGANASGDGYLSIGTPMIWGSFE